MSNPSHHLTPLTDRVIIAPEKAPEKSSGGIILVEQPKDKPSRGIVVACGRGRYSDAGVLLPMTVHVGDDVMFNRYSASEFEFNGEKLYMMHEHEISCVIKK